MVKYKYNKPYYKLHLSELDEDAVQVYSVEGEESISRLFQYRFELISEDPELNAKDILDKKATFIITRGEDEPLKIHGVISNFEQMGRTPDYVSYFAILVPKLWRTSLNYGSRIFQKMDIEKVITEVLKDNDFASEDYEFSLSGSYPEFEYCVQYRETDFDFINRRLEHYGIYYYFDHKEDNDVLIFTDKMANLNSIDSDDINYNPNMDTLSEKESITEITCKEKVVTGMFRLKDYNYEFPNKELVVENQIDSDAPGTYYEYGDHFKEISEGDVLVKIRNEEIYCRSKIFYGKSDCRLFRVGFKYTLGDHYRKDWNDEFLLTKIRFKGSQYGLFALQPASRKDLPTYENTFEAILTDREYRPPRITPIPQIPGIMTARMEKNNDDEYAFIDDQGRYKVKVPFDLSDKTDGAASRPIRLSQPYTGSNYGIHFPNHTDTEMVWSCIDGNVDRPLGIGTVPNPSNTSPSTSRNKHQSIIRTASQNELTFDDKTGSENIYLHGTKDWTIDIANDEKHTIGNNRDKSVGNDQSETVGANKTITVGGNHSESITGNLSQTVSSNKTETITIAKATTIGAAFQISVGAAMNETVGAAKAEEIGAAKSVNVGSNSSENIGANKTVNAGKDISESAGKNVSKQAGEDFNIQSGKKMLLSAGDDFGLAGDKTGVIQIKDQLTLNCGKASLIMKKNGEIILKGGKITIKASKDLVMKGSKVTDN